VHTLSVVGDDPVYMLTGPIPATQAALKRSGLSIGDIDAFEINEAFAPVVLAWSGKPERPWREGPTSTAARSRWAIRWAPPARYWPPS